MKVVNELEHLLHKEKLRELRMFILEKKSSGGSFTCEEIPDGKP